MMHQDSLEPAAIRFTLERLQEYAYYRVCTVSMVSTTRNYTELLVKCDFISTGVWC